MITTPRHGHEPIKMRPINGRHRRKVGDFYWQTSKTGERDLVVACPDQNRDCGFVFCRFTIAHRNTCGAQWDWDGNEVKPTLAPSLHPVGIWHGFVRGGYLIEA